MESVTIEEFEKETQTVKFILIILGIFCAYRLIKGSVNLENVLILLVSIIGYFSVITLTRISVKKINNDSYKIPFIQSEVLGFFLIIVLGTLSCYLFFYKGIYGLYRLFYEFSFGKLLFRIIIFFYALFFGKALSKINTVFNSIKRGNSIKY